MHFPDTFLSSNKSYDWSDFPLLRKHLKNLTSTYVTPLDVKPSLPRSIDASSNQKRNISSISSTDMLQQSHDFDKFLKLLVKAQENKSPPTLANEELQTEPENMKLVSQEQDSLETSSTSQEEASSIIQKDYLLETNSLTMNNRPQFTTTDTVAKVLPTALLLDKSKHKFHESKKKKLTKLKLVQPVVPPEKKSDTSAISEDLSNTDSIEGQEISLPKVTAIQTLTRRLISNQAIVPKKPESQNLILGPKYGRRPPLEELLTANDPEPSLLEQSKIDQQVIVTDRPVGIGRRPPIELLMQANMPTRDDTREDSNSDNENDFAHRTLEVKTETTPSHTTNKPSQPRWKTILSKDQQVKNLFTKNGVRVPAEHMNFLVTLEKIKGDESLLRKGGVAAIKSLPGGEFPGAVGGDSSEEYTQPRGK